MSLKISPELRGKLKRAELRAVVTRADGTVVDLGVLSAGDYSWRGKLIAAVTWLKGVFQ